MSSSTPQSLPSPRRRQQQSPSTPKSRSLLSCVGDLVPGRKSRAENNSTIARLKLPRKELASPRQRKMSLSTSDDWSHDRSKDERGFLDRAFETAATVDEYDD